MQASRPARVTETTTQIRPEARWSAAADWQSSAVRRHLSSLRPLKPLQDHSCRSRAHAVRISLRKDLQGGTCLRLGIGRNLGIGSKLDFPREVDCMDESGLLPFVSVVEQGDQRLGLGAFFLERRNIGVHRLERIKGKALVKARLQEGEPCSRCVRGGRRKADRLLQLLPWKKVALERLLKLRSQIALGDPPEQKLSVHRQLAAMCRHVTIEKISCFDQDHAKRKQRPTPRLLVRRLPCMVCSRIGCRNELVRLVQIDDLVSGCRGERYYKKKPNQ